MYLAFPHLFNLLVPSCGFPAALCSPKLCTFVAQYACAQDIFKCCWERQHFWWRGTLLWQMNLLYCVFLLYVMQVQ